MYANLNFSRDKKGIGLHIDSSLYNGTSEPCNTFNLNESLSGNKDFTIKDLEVDELLVDIG